MNDQVVVQIANADKVALGVLADVLMPPPPVDYERWAVDNIVFPAGEDYPGPYNPEVFPFWSKVLKALSPDDPCRTVTLSKSAQLGGTILALIFILGGLDMDPGPTGVVHPSDVNASTWSKQKLAAFLRQNARLARLFPEDGKDGGNSILYKERVDGRGFIEAAGANSPSRLSMRTWWRVVMDDLAKWELNAAGDPEAQAESRAQAIEFAKLFKVSTPLLEGSCRITRSYNAGSMERYHVPCPHCQSLIVLRWQDMLDAWETHHHVGFVCGTCGGLIEERHRAWMVAPENGACWIAERLERMRVHRSFWIWSAYGPLMSWQRIIDGWENAKGSPALEQVFVNDIAGEAYSGDSEQPPTQALIERARNGHQRGTIPVGHWIVTVGVDVQEDRLEWHALAFGPGMRRAVIDYGVIPFSITDERGRQRLDALVAASWPIENGNRIAVDRLAIDGGYDTPAVFAWVRRHPISKVLMVRGVSGYKDQVLRRVKEGSDRTGSKKKYGRRFYNLAVDLLKLTTYRALKITDAMADWFVSFPAGLEDDYFEQLTSERRVQKRNARGHMEIVWDLPAGQRNEVLDTFVYGEAAARNFGYFSLTDIDWQRLAEERGKPPDEQLDLETTIVAKTASAATSSAPVNRHRRTLSQGI